MQGVHGAYKGWEGLSDLLRRGYGSCWGDLLGKCTALAKGRTGMG